MPRVDSHPIAYAAGEAIADRATIALVVWEVGGGIKFRTLPGDSLSVLIGLHDRIGVMIDQMREAGSDDADDETGTDA